jgi:hypothetical protein
MVPFYDSGFLSYFCAAFLFFYCRPSSAFAKLPLYFLPSFCCLGYSLFAGPLFSFADCSFSSSLGSQYSFWTAKSIRSCSGNIW